jgi:hypothetical protein
MWYKGNQLTNQLTKGNQMKITIAQLTQILLNFVGTTIIRIHAITPQNGEFHAGIDGSLLKADKMLTKIGVDFKDIMKEQWTNFMLTSCNYGQLVQNVVAGNISSELKELGVELTDIDKKDLKKGLTEYEVSARRNGTTVNGYYVISSKDAMGMITVYRNIKASSKVQFIYGSEVIDKNDSSSRFAPYFKNKENKASEKQIAYANENGVDLRKFLITNNFRLDNIKHITMNKVEYEIVSE